MANPGVFRPYLHSIRSLYQNHELYALKSILLVGVSNIIGVARNNAGSFNIADNLPVDLFSEDKICELSQMHSDQFYPLR